MLLEVKKAEGLPVAGAFQIGPDVDAEIQVYDPAQQRGERIQNDNGVGE